MNPEQEEIGRFMAKIILRQDPRDRALLMAILDEEDAARSSEMIMIYWKDAVRADRTDRAIQYFHMGILAAHVKNLTEILPNSSQN
jgi:hypothetical protein